MTIQQNDPQADSPTTEEKLRKVDADLVDAEDSGYKSSDQDIDTAGTDADDQSPTKALGTGIAQPRNRG